MSSRSVYRSPKGSSKGKRDQKYSKNERDHDSEDEVETATSRLKKHAMPDLSYWLDRLRVAEADSRARRQQHSESTYQVLSQPVRHELNKFFFDVTPTPSKAQRKQLWYNLLAIDPNVCLSKITRWFQNKRQYMKRQYGVPDDFPQVRSLVKPSHSARRPAHTSDDENSYGSQSEADSDEE